MRKPMDPVQAKQRALQPTRTRSRRLTTTPSHHGPSGSRNPQPLQSHQPSQPVPSQHNPASSSSGHPSGVRSAASSPNDSHKWPGSGSIGSVNPSPANGNQSLPYTLKWINGKKYFECNVCTKTFSFQSKLIRHLPVHKGEQPFKCKICKKPFTRQDNLKFHVRTHTEEKTTLSVPTSPDERSLGDSNGSDDEGNNLSNNIFKL